MTIHASGSSLAASQILAEINVTSLISGCWASHEGALRELAQKPSGTVKFSDFYSKTSFAAFNANPTALPHSGIVSNATEINMLFNWASSDETGDQDYNVTSKNGVGDEAEEVYVGIDLGNTNLRGMPFPQLRMHLVSGPSGATSGTPTIIYKKDNAVVSSGSIDNVWVDLSSFYNFILNTAGTTGTITCQVAISFRWPGNAASEITKTITLTRP
ncbi:MAG: hypothetical protein JWN23_1540 [Rhodocyclales bacterium]|nr:hypothetical protein [Rhodocyclales bacterium]